MKRLITLVVATIACIAPAHNAFAMQARNKSLFQHYNLGKFENRQKMANPALAKQMGQLIAAQTFPKLSQKAGWWYELTRQPNISAIAYHPNQDWIFIIESNTGIGRLFDSGGAPVYNAHGRAITFTEIQTAQFSPKGGKLLLISTVDAGSKIQVWDYMNERQIIQLAPVSIETDPVTGKVLEERELPTNSAVMNEAETEILTASGDRAILWNLAGEKIREYKHRYKSVVSSAAFNPQQIEVDPETLVAKDRLILTAGQDSLAILWYKETGKKLTIYKHPSSLARAEFSPTGEKVFATCGFGGVARLWEVVVPEARAKKPLEISQEKITYGHSPGRMSIVGSIAFTPDGKQLLTGGAANNNAILWELDGKKLRNFDFDTWVDQVAFNHTGGRMGIVTTEAFFEWQRYDDYTLEQVMLRHLLGTYLVRSRTDTSLKKPSTFKSAEDLLKAVAEKNGLDAQQLRTVWQTLPELLQQSIYTSLTKGSKN